MGRAKDKLGCNRGIGFRTSGLRGLGFESLGFRVTLNPKP